MCIESYKTRDPTGHDYLLLVIATIVCTRLLGMHPNPYRANKVVKAVSWAWCANPWDLLLNWHLNMLIVFENGQARTLVDSGPSLLIWADIVRTHDTISCTAWYVTLYNPDHLPLVLYFSDHSRTMGLVLTEAQIHYSQVTCDCLHTNLRNV